VKGIIYITLILLLGFKTFGQLACESHFVSDTMSTFSKNTVLEGSYIETTLKKGSVLRFYKTNDEKYYLRFLVNENFYFDKTDMLEIVSGHKSYYANDTKQHKVNKNLGLFILEIPKNYISQLKDHGITALVFAHAETHFTKSDCKFVKEICTCFYNSIQNKK
jgi:hypothetical protein